MKELPTEVEIDQVVADMPREKLAGIDGVLSKMLQKFWSLMHLACIGLVHTFSMDGKLTTRAVGRVIKLIPNNLAFILL